MKGNLVVSIRKNLLSNIYGVGVGILNQLVLVPLYLLFWGVDLYADWIALTALSSFFSMTNAGLNTVTQNRYAIKWSENKEIECNSLLTNNAMLISFAFVMSLLIYILYISFFDITKHLNLHVINLKEAEYILFVLICYIFLGMYNELLNSIYRATSKAYIAFYLTNTMLLLEGCVIVVTLMFHFSVYVIVSLYLLPRLFMLFYRYVNAKKMIDFTISLKMIDYKLFKEMLFPSLTFLSIPFGYTILLQGSTLLINNFFDVNSVVLFNTTRTICNFVTSILSTIKNSIWPEFSLKYGVKDYISMSKLLRFSLYISLLLSLIVSAFLLVFGEKIYSIWLHDKICFDYSLMSAFLLVVIVHAIWNSCSVALEATNNHSIMGILFLSLSIIFIPFSMIVHYYNHSLYAIVYCQLLLEISLCCYVLRKSFNLIRFDLK